MRDSPGFSIVALDLLPLLLLLRLMRLRTSAVEGSGARIQVASR